MAQFMYPSSSSLSASSDCLYMHYSTVVTAATVQFPTPMSQPLTALAPNIDLPQWQHAVILPSSTTMNAQPQRQHSDVRLLPQTSSSSSSSSSSSVVLHGKRKMLTDVDSDCPVKVFVNEDRMAARLHDLHLDNNNLDWHPDLEREPWYSRRLSDRRGQRSSVGVTSSSDQQQTVKLCCELEMDLKNKQILPKVILDELKKSSMQVVLWKPPGHFVHDFISNTGSSELQQQQQRDDDDDDEDEDDTSHTLTAYQQQQLMTNDDDDDDMDL